MARKEISVLSIGLLITFFGFTMIGVGAFTANSGVCFATSAIMINPITANPSAVGTGQAFTVSGTMFAGSGCPLSDSGIVYSTYSVYWWIPNLPGYAGSFVVNNAGAFSITNIPTISQAGSYTVIVSPYPQSQQNTCVDTSTFTCTNAQITVTVQSTQTVTYPFTFSLSPTDQGATLQIKDSSGNSQYLTIGSSSTPVVQLTAGDYSYFLQPNNDPSVVGNYCLNTKSGTFSVGSYDLTTTPTSLTIKTSTYYCGAPPSNITFVISPTVAGTVTLNGVTQTISNGQVTFQNVPSGTYSYTVTPSANYPNCLYAVYPSSIYLPQAGGSVNVPLQPSNSPTCQAPSSSTSSTSSHSSQASSSQSSSTSTSNSNTCQFQVNCPPPTVKINGIEIIGAVIALFGIFTTFAGAVRGRR